MLPLIPIALSLAPMLARWLGGNDAAAVTAQVAEAARAVVGSDDPAQVEAAIADPAKRTDLAIELARIAAEREAAEHSARLEELRVAAADRADARGMARAGGPLAWGAGLVTLACVGLLGALIWLLTMEIPGENREALNILLGLVGTAFVGAVQFWVGSSAGSAGKSGLFGPFGSGVGR